MQEISPISTIPIELLEYIINRETILPICRMVCKYWQNILDRRKSSPWFIAHLSRENCDKLISWLEQYTIADNRIKFRSMYEIGKMLSNDIKYFTENQYIPSALLFINAIVAKRTNILEELKKNSKYIKELSKELCNEPKDTDSNNIYYSIPHYAIRYNNRETFDWYLSLNTQMHNVSRHMIFELVKYKRYWMTQDLEAKALPEIDISQLFYAIVLGDLEFVKFQLKNLENFLIHDNFPMMACYYGHFHVYKWFLELLHREPLPIERFMTLLGGHWFNYEYSEINISDHRKLIEEEINDLLITSGMFPAFDEIFKDIELLNFWIQLINDETFVIPSPKKYVQSLINKSSQYNVPIYKYPR